MRCTNPGLTYTNYGKRSMNLPIGSRSINDDNGASLKMFPRLFALLGTRICSWYIIIFQTSLPWHVYWPKEEGDASDLQMLQ